MYPFETYDLRLATRNLQLVLVGACTHLKLATCAEPETLRLRTYDLRLILGS